MESVHGVDISWMSKHNSHNSAAKDQSVRTQTSPSNGAVSPPLDKAPNGTSPPKEPAAATTPKPTSLPHSHRPVFSRTVSTEKTSTLNGTSPKPVPVSPNTSRRNSWLSSISSKFSSSPTAHAAHTTSNVPASPQTATTPSAQEPHSTIVPSGQRVAVLQPGVKAPGDEPYTPAPPKVAQPSFLQSALRRLSSSGGQLHAVGKGGQHGLCERKVLNVDPHRERCQISELDQSKLRRVAFCVDVEIASGPRYLDEAGDDSKLDKKDKKKKLTEKGEGDALKNPESAAKEKEDSSMKKATGESLQQLPPKEPVAVETEVTEDSQISEKDTTKKKEKKKRSEEERKARKEKKRKLAEANGTLPVELVRNDSDDSSILVTPGTDTPKTQASPTTDPVRIYRRCCQLRETPILKKISEQLATATSPNGQPGVVNKLDLTDYWLQLPDLVTLGDYLAVVPVKELIMENCGLSDEGVRVILAGLLAAKGPDFQRRKFKKMKGSEVPHGGFVERVVFKNNPKIGREGWRYICLFINMCRSIKCLDLSKVPFPQNTAATTPPSATTNGSLHKTLSSATASSELSSVLERAFGERLAGPELELVNVAECGLTTEQLSALVEGVIKSGLRRLGVAGNNITPEGMQHIARYLREGKCEGLDLGGNNLKDQLGVIADALSEDNEIYALSLADCSLVPDSLRSLFPALATLKNFKFIDLSQNHALFDAEPDALSLLRRYMPKMPFLKRIHLTDVSMTTEQAIAFAEILSESPSLAHVNIMENPQIAALADAKDEANQEEACALYASLMAAVRVSRTIICVDVEVPSNDSSEVVKALAKQVVAYCLWNMERGPVAEIQQELEAYVNEKDVAVPEVLLHLVGHGGSSGPDTHDDDEPAPDEDYVIGGTGVVKALGICLRNRGDDSRRPSADRTFSDMSDVGNGSATPNPPVSGGKAKDMSKNLLGSARKIRARLQPALVKESRTGDRNNYQRLVFLDQTLMGMIKRFEDEFPETRLPSDVSSQAVPDSTQRLSESPELDPGLESRVSDTDQPLADQPPSDDDDGVRPVLSRHNSDVSLASRALSQEEGRMHRFGQQLRRDILKPESEDYHHGTSGREDEPRHLQLLRAMVEGLGGEEIRNKLMAEGQDAVIEELNNDASSFRQQLIDSDPEGWEKFKDSMEAAQKNNIRSSGLSGAAESSGSAVE